MMLTVLAKFRLPDGGPSYSEIWAATWDEARKIAHDRGMFEISAARGDRKEFRPSVLATLPGGWGRPDVLHSLCYLSFLAARHGVASAEQLTGDESPLHELAHYLSGPNMRGGKMLAFLESRVDWLENIIPGMPPKDWAGVLPSAEQDGR